MKGWFKKIGKKFSKNTSQLESIDNKKEISINEPSKTLENKPKLVNKKEKIIQEQKEKVDKLPEKNSKSNFSYQVKSTDTKKKTNWLDKLGENFKKTSTNIKVALFSKKLDQDTLSNIEDAFLMSDLGVSFTELLIEELKKKKFEEENIRNQVSIYLESQFSYTNHDLVFNPTEKLKVILVFGVNGSGKTTTIAKLANKEKLNNKKILIAAADTFRAAATEQIKTWGNRIGVEVLAGKKEEDPSSVVFKAHKKAIEENYNLLIIDTAGRLHNKIELMEELKKMLRIIKKNDANAPHNKILVLDSTIGQNAYNQIDVFQEKIGITGIIMTKLDGSSKGGSLIGIAKKYKLPIHAVGVGEQVDDLVPFIPKDFINALLGATIGEKK